MIPLDQLDWTKSGDRTNWCTSQQWWVNGNIFLEGASGGPTQPAVGDSVTISVGVQGVQVPDSESQPTAVVQNTSGLGLLSEPHRRDVLGFPRPPLSKSERRQPAYSEVQRHAGASSGEPLRCPLRL